MNKLLLALLILGNGAITFAALRRSAERAQVARLACDAELKAITNRVAELYQSSAWLRDEMTIHRTQLRQASSRPSVRPELLELAEGKASDTGSSAGSELRQQLGIGWDSSADYVLVNKRVLQKIELHPFDYNGKVTGTARAVLAISSAERSELNEVAQRARAEVLARVQRAEPVGDTVAQYTFPPDPILEQSISNNFSATLLSSLGPQRADVLLDQGWRELRARLPPIGQETVTMTIRRSVTDGGPDLSCEVKQGASSVLQDVRYATYPSPWFTLLFPGGWRELADREGFELPEAFQKHQ